MKKVLTIICMLLLSTTAVFANWQAVGAPGAASDGTVFSGDIIINPSTDRPTVIHQDQGNTPGGQVKEFDGTNWVSVGSGFSFGPGYWYGSMAFDANNDLWTFGRDYSNPIGDGTIATHDYSGPTSNVFNAAASIASAHDVGIAAHGNQIVVSFEDEALNPTYGTGNVDPNLDLLSVKEFDSTTNAFTALGAASTSTMGFVKKTEVAFDSTGKLYASFTSHPSGKANVIEYDATLDTWSYLEGPEFTSTGASGLQLVIDNNDVPWIFYHWWKYIVAMKYDSATNTWSQVGSWASGPYNAAQSGSAWRYWIGADFDPATNEPLVTFNLHPSFHGTDGNRVAVTRFDGTNWNAVGSLVSTGQAHFPRVVVDSTGQIFVYYKDLDQGGKATVMTFANNLPQSMGSGCEIVANSMIPTIHSNGQAAVGGSNFDVHIQNGAPNANAIVYGSVQLIPPYILPGFPNCEIYLHEPYLPLATTTLDANGDGIATLQLPAGYSGVPYGLQAVTVVSSQSGTSDFALSNALVGTVV